MRDAISRWWHDRVIVLEDWESVGCAVNEAIGTDEEFKLLLHDECVQSIWVWLWQHAVL